MKTFYKIFSDIDYTITYYSFPIVIQNFFYLIMFILYLINALYFYAYILNDYLLYVDEYTYNTKFYQKFNNYNNSDNNESNNPNQRPDTNLIEDENDRDEGINTNANYSENDCKNDNKNLIPLPKILINYQGKILSKDGDNLASWELQKRIWCTKGISILNNDSVNRLANFSDRFADMYTITNVFNSKSNVIKNSNLLVENYLNNGIFTTINNPISHNQKIFVSSVWASGLDLNDTKNYHFHDIDRPDSRVKKTANANSPFTQSTFSHNDTWDEKMRSNEIVKNFGDDITKEYKTKCEIF